MLITQVELRHLDAFIAELSTLRAKRMVLHGQAPFGRMPPEMTAVLPNDEDTSTVLRSLVGLDREGGLTAAIHAYIGDVLLPGRADPESVLGDFLYYHMCGEEEGNNTDDDTLARRVQEYMGSALSNKHAVQLFAFLVEEGYKRQYRL